MSAVRPAENLLEQVAENALDDDYYVVRAGEPYGDRSAMTPAVGVVVAVLAALLTITAVQTQNDRPGSDLERRTLAADVADRRDVLAARQGAAEALRDQVAALQGGAGPETSTDVASDTVLAGGRALRGTALVVTMAGSPDGERAGRLTVQDLLTVVNGLWYAGAEAISVGGQRLTSESAISSIDGNLTVNFSRIEVPVRIVALGDGASLRSRLESNPAGRYLAGRADSAGISVGMAPSDDEEVPSAPEEQTGLRRAEPLPASADDARGEG
ncbi:DUF881 domain-containing protein [Aeromicrobium sp.]|uniref:DUF881 domain-containing protein n=1 Tax=Aeromicrobium sp. TaxID=1871063 RepID=UPI004033DA19